MSGLDWQGKNLLLITHQYGSRVRLVTVLTNALLDGKFMSKKQMKEGYESGTGCKIAPFYYRQPVQFFARALRNTYWRMPPFIK